MGVGEQCLEFLHAFYEKTCIPLTCTARCITRTAFLRQEGTANNIGGFVGQN